MDYGKLVQDLHLELARITNIIGKLETLRESHGTSESLARAKRGRKSMGPEERVQVSERMKRYWAGRRQTRTQ